MGQPIEEQAAAAVSHEGSPVERYAAEALKATEAPAEEPTSSSGTFLLAQQRFIAAQTAFIHQQGNLKLMFGAQLDFLVELQHYIGSHKMPTVLSAQERFIAELQSIIEAERMI